jgi:hypothetical protein
MWPTYRRKDKSGRRLWTIYTSGVRNKRRYFFPLRNYQFFKTLHHGVSYITLHILWSLSWNRRRQCSEQIWGDRKVYGTFTWLHSIRSIYTYSRAVSCYLNDIQASETCLNERMRTHTHWRAYGHNRRWDLFIDFKRSFPSLRFGQHSIKW